MSQHQDAGMVRSQPQRSSGTQHPKKEGGRGGCKRPQLYEITRLRLRGSTPHTKNRVESKKRSHIPTQQRVGGGGWAEQRHTSTEPHSSNDLPWRRHGNSAWLSCLSTRCCTHLKTNYLYIVAGVCDPLTHSLTHTYTCIHTHTWALIYAYSQRLCHSDI